MIYAIILGVLLIGYISALFIITIIYDMEDRKTSKKQDVI